MEPVFGALIFAAFVFAASYNNNSPYNHLHVSYSLRRFN